MRSTPRILFLPVLFFVLVSPQHLYPQATQLAKIIGNVRVTRGDFPSHQVLVSLEMRGSEITSAYSDPSGRIGFYALPANEYKVMVNDDAFEPFSETINVDPSISTVYFVQITLNPRANSKKDAIGTRVGGSNPYLVDPAEYYRNFPKKTLKEYDKGMESDKKGDRDAAVQHYLKALEYSPDFYPAHNNLGTDYLSQQNFSGAQEQFEAALKSNQNDGQAYFNLANVFLLTRQYDDAERQITEGLKRRPDSAFGKFLQGSVYTRTGRTELAEKSLQNALLLDPKMSQAYLQLVNLYLLEKRPADAATQLETYLKEFPDSPFSPKARDLLKRLQSESSADSK
jgi:tetratricopeptide (TPR) repeat protein